MENEVRLINANDIVEVCNKAEKKWGRRYYLTWELVRLLVSKVRTVDAVKVIRCHECQNRTEDPETGKLYCRKPLGCMGCIQVKPDDFCSRGERKMQDDPR